MYALGLDQKNPLPAPMYRSASGDQEVSRLVYTTNALQFQRKSD